MLYRNWRSGAFTKLIDRYIVLSQFAAGRFAGAALNGGHPGPGRGVGHLLAGGRHVFARRDAAGVVGGPPG